jgi:uncharacterized protein YbjT (DUF2867 family)
MPNSPRHRGAMNNKCILVTGAGGYIGGRLVPMLLKTGYQVRCLARDPARLQGRFDNAEVIAGDLLDEKSLQTTFNDVDTAFYLVHSMSTVQRDFAETDRRAARIFACAAAGAGVRRIIYLGGLGAENDRLSSHLRSRHEVGEILREGGIPVTEFRAAIIVGSGSISFEMLRYLTERLPIMIAPRWVNTRCQPIAVADVLSYLVTELTMERTEHIIYEIGGNDTLSYREMMLRYAAIRGLRRAVIVVPFFTPRLSSAWVHLVTPISASYARPLIDGLRNEVIVHDKRATIDFPFSPIGYDEAVRRALDRYQGDGPQTTWFDARSASTPIGTFSGSEEGMLIDRREHATDASQERLFRVFTGLGGERGWLYANYLWNVRGVLDRMIGGVGLRRGRRSPTSLRVGDALDFWRVEAYEPHLLLRLRAEMRLPGAAWLQFEALPASESGGSTLRQTAFFDPHGLFGYLYWYALSPLHAVLFGTLANRIAEEAERAP